MPRRNGAGAQADQNGVAKSSRPLRQFRSTLTHTRSATFPAGIFTPSELFNYCFSRRYVGAIELARKGVELEPDSAFILAFQGVAYAEQGRFNEAVDILERAARLDNSLTILALQAHVLAVAGRTQQAKVLLRHVQDAAKH